MYLNCKFCHVFIYCGFIWGIFIEIGFFFMNGAADGGYIIVTYWLSFTHIIDNNIIALSLLL